MDLETAIQSEVSQKEKNKCHIVTHVCGIRKKLVQMILLSKQKHRHR